MKQENATVVLDCTFRDGGYYTNWSFSVSLINQYLRAMDAAAVDVVELGFRFGSNDSFRGPCAHATEGFLQKLDIPTSLTVAVMVNASDLHTAPNLEVILNSLFPVHASESKVDFVRIACHSDELSVAYGAAEWLASKGYQVGLNLMQISMHEEKTIKEFALSASDLPIDVVYFADSLGALKPDNVERIIRWIRTSWLGPIGIHAHDNMGLALSNTLTAKHVGASWFDATVTGMGRGPGNTLMEELLIELPVDTEPSRDLSPLFALIDDEFLPLKMKCGWGKNVYYYLAAKGAVHPTYIQQMLQDNRFSSDDILGAIRHLSGVDGSKFHLGTLEGSRLFFSRTGPGVWHPSSVLEGQEVLIVGSGPSVEEHTDGIKAFIENRGPTVMGLNLSHGDLSDHLDLRVSCHPIRLMAQLSSNNLSKCPIIAPISALPEKIKSQLACEQFFDFGLSFSEKGFAFHDNYCVVNSPLALAYALAVCASGKASKVYLIGVDGYGADDPRNAEIQMIIDEYISTEGSVNLCSIGPTQFKLPVKSLYALCG